MGTFVECPVIRTPGYHLVELREPLVYKSDWSWATKKGPVHTFVVPKGFVCDLASIPKFITWLVPSWDQTAGAGILHDWLYRTGLLSRLDADALFYEALRAEPSTGRFWAFWMWAAVRVFGWGPWTCNRLSEIG
jgi:hypothetical protein